MHHEDHVLNHLGVIDQVEQERCRDVVGKIADDAQSFSRGKGYKIEGKRVGLMQNQFAMARRHRGQPAGEIAIKLDCVKPATPIKQAQRQRAAAWTDFHDELIRLWIKY